jgi:hypothetical protein
MSKLSLRALNRATLQRQWLLVVAREPPALAHVLRYLNASGPASVTDVQAWSGLTKLAEVVDRFRPQLRTYADLESGRELFDVLGNELPDPDVPAPTRSLPEYDNLLLSHADRNRMINNAQRSRLVVRETRSAVLYDGRVCAMWKVQQQGKKSATQEVEPITRLTARARSSIEAEGRRLLGFVADPTAVTEMRVLA